MDFVSIRIITGDVARLVDFYERATGVQASWSTPDFAELKTASATASDADVATALSRWLLDLSVYDEDLTVGTADTFRRCPGTTPRGTA